MDEHARYQDAIYLSNRVASLLPLHVQKVSVAQCPRHPAGGGVQGSRRP